TKNNAGGDTQATLAKLATATATATGAKAATIQTDKGTFTSDGTTFDGASMSIDANTFANAVKNDTYTATVGAKTYSVTTGSAAADTAYMSNGVLSDTPPTYYAQADGSITTTE
ncbi:flagellin FliC, partial [Escherichia coli]|nr:flagellin FliC [Escherichia coli]